MVWAVLLNRKARRAPKGQKPLSFVILAVLPVLLGVLSTRLPPITSPRFPYVRMTHQTTKTASVRVLARQESTTGLIMVGEHIEESFRFLRADHSLLGGRWIGTKVASDSRNGLGESIYSTFVLQEAIRLIEPRDFRVERKRERERERERALFM